MNIMIRTLTLVLLTSLYLRGADQEIRSFDDSLKNGNWFQFEGIIDTVYKNNKFLIIEKESKRKIEVKTKDPIELANVMSLISVVGVYQRYDTIQSKSDIQGVLITKGDSIIYEQRYRSTIPDSLEFQENNAMNRVVYGYRKNKKSSGLATLIPGSAMLLWGTVWSIAQAGSSNRAHSADTVYNDFSSAISDISNDIYYSSVKIPKVVLISSGGALTILGITKLQKAKRAPRVEIRKKKVSVEVVPIISKSHQGVSVVGKF